MTRWNLSRCVLSVSIAAALLSGCGGAQPPMSAGAIPQAQALAARPNRTHYRVVYSFGVPPDGNIPRAGLIDVGGTLYGTTISGGAHSCATGPGCGTVFSVTTGGTEKVLYSFGAPPDGDKPSASLLDVGGILYGTTSEGGSNYPCTRYYSGCGTAFSITTDGVENVLYNFRGYYEDGAGPNASLIKVKGLLYGTTAGGGAQCDNYYYPEGCGTVFSITTGGTESVLHKFGPFGQLGESSDDGFDPEAALIDVGGKLYGTTQHGGRYRWATQRGTVFRILPSGREKVLHRFGKGTDGANPSAGLIDVGGTLYGTTDSGGAFGSCGGNGCGTVFSITPSGTEKVLHSFGKGSDGSVPTAPLIDVGGTLYGTTSAGGSACSGSGGCGTVFKITLSGREKVLHNFSYDGGDGVYPVASLTNVNGTLYGTTSEGGTYNRGTVFALTP